MTASACRRLHTRLGAEVTQINPAMTFVYVSGAGDDFLRRAPDDHKNRCRDEEADDRICQRIVQPNAERAEEHREARPTIVPRVVSISYKRGTSNLLSNFDAEDRDALVA